MFNLSFGEIALIMIVALIVLGPERLPSVARLLGKTLGEFRRTVDDFKADLHSSVHDESNPPRLTATRLPAGDETAKAEEPKGESGT